jgi:hypothetical protein
VECCASQKQGNLTADSRPFTEDAAKCARQQTYVGPVGSARRDWDEVGFDLCQRVRNLLDPLWLVRRSFVAYLDGQCARACEKAVVHSTTGEARKDLAVRIER